MLELDQNDRQHYDVNRKRQNTSKKKDGAELISNI